jgi:hypothetical protein
LGARRYLVISSCPKMVTSVTERPLPHEAGGRRVEADGRAVPQRAVEDMAQG